MASSVSTPAFAWGEVDNRTLAADVGYAALGPLTTFGDSADRVQADAALTVAAATVLVRLMCQRVSDNVWVQIGPTMTLTTADRSASVEEPIPPGKYDGAAWAVSGILATGAQVDASISLRFSAEV